MRTPKKLQHQVPSSVAAACRMQPPPGRPREDHVGTQTQSCKDLSPLPREVGVQVHGAPIPHVRGAKGSPRPPMELLFQEALSGSGGPGASAPREVGPGPSAAS